MKGESKMEERNKIAVSALDSVLTRAFPVTYWQDGIQVSRRDIFDDCEVIAIDLDFPSFDGCLRTHIAVYVGDRLGGAG